jgi:hypothetical protein
LEAKKGITGDIISLTLTLSQREREPIENTSTKEKEEQIKTTDQPHWPTT